MDSFGSVADWLTAGASAGALGVAFAAFWTARRLGRLEFDRDVRARERGQREQAASVTAWVATQIVNGKEAGYGVVLHNASQNVVYDLSVSTTSKLPRWELPALKLTVLPPGTYWTRSRPKTAYKWDFPVEVSRLADEIRPVSKSQEIGVAHLAFRDSSDQFWERRANGILAQATASA
jgi:hypothetical protein